MLVIVYCPETAAVTSVAGRGEREKKKRKEKNKQTKHTDTPMRIRRQLL